MKKELTARKKWVNNVKFKGDGEVMNGTYWSQPLWEFYKKDLEKVVLKHKWYFTNYIEGQASFDAVGYKPGYRKEEYYTDAWGCRWFKVDGYDVGQIRSHPLSDPSQLADYTPPDLTVTDEWGNPQDWKAYAQNIKNAHKNGQIYIKDWSLRIFERPHFLMDMENLMIAMATDDPFADKVIGLVLYENLRMIDKMIEYGKPDMIGFSDDLGDQRNLLISPELWRKYLKPAYRAMFATCKAGGALTGLHSDGQNSSIFEDLYEIGLNLLNCQVSLIGIDTVAKSLKGKICISADIDRQNVMPFGTPKDVDDLVKELIMKLGSPRGGLILSADIYPDVPLANIAAYLDAVKKYRFYWVGRNI